MSESGREPLAIVGIGCRFPGGATNPSSFWELLREGKSGIIEVPENRWNTERYYDKDPQVPGKMITKWGGFINAFDQFDARFFGISPREALRMDPQQRWLLEVAWEAMEDGGQVPDRVSGSSTGVFIGIASNDYANIQMKGPLDVDVHTNSGSTLSIASNRISYIFNLKGPSVSVDTACSSALVAVNLACHSIWDRQCEAALAGGVNALLTPDSSIGFSKASMLSPSGQCFAFDARANGYVRGEGAGILFLKKLSRAREDRDPVYAIIRAAVVNQDGRTNAMTVPGLESQSAMLREAYRQAGISPDKVAYLEAHGTGTPVGDPIEVRALGKVLSIGRSRGKECVLGSVKTNIGHLESGSGVAGLIKVALVLKHGEIPPSLNFETPNPNIPFEELRLRVATEREPLPNGGERSIAAVNSFGFGGTNAHIVLEAPERKKASRKRGGNGKRKIALLPISAKTPEALKAYSRAYREILEGEGKGGSAFLRDFASSAGLRKNHHEHRLAVTGATCEEIAGKLKGWEEEDKKLPGLAVDRADSGKPEIVFVFSGQGPQWWGMGQELLNTEPVFRRTLEKIDRLMRPLSDWSLLEEMTRGKEESEINSTHIAQPAIFALQVGLAELWKTLGVEASRVVGHSVGEVAAAYWAGIYSLEDAVKVIFHRSRLQETRKGTGRMAAAGISEEKAREAIRGFEDRVSVAVVNSPSMVTLAGDTEALESIVGALEKNKVFIRWLRIDYAFHTHQMDPIKEELLASLSDIKPQKGTLPFYSTVSGDLLGGENLDALYWWKNVRHAVRFSAALGQIFKAGGDIFLELGPHPIHSSALDECLAQAGKEGLALSSLRRQEPEVEAIFETAGRLYTVGYPLDWKSANGPHGDFIRLPSYPWQHERYWLESEESKNYRLGKVVHPLLGLRIPSPHPTWECIVHPRAFPYLKDHRFWDSMIFPAAAYAEMGLAVCRELFPDDPYVVEDLRTEKALFLSENSVPTLRLVFEESDGTFKIYSSAVSNLEWELNAQGRIQKLSSLKSDWEDLGTIRARLPEKFNHKTYYKEYEEAGYQFGPNFQHLRNVWRKAGESLGEIVVPGKVLENLKDYHFHPAVLDACFQCVKGAQIVPEGHEASEYFYLPAAIRRVRLYRDLEPRLWGHVMVHVDDGEIVLSDISVFNKRGERVADILGFLVERVEQAESGSEDDLERCFYQFKWEQRHLWGSGSVGSTAMENPFRLVEKLKPSIDKTYERYDLKAYFGQFTPTLERLCLALVLKTFEKIGWRPEEGEVVSFDKFLAETGIAEQHHRLTRAFFNAMEREGILRKTGKGEWEVLAVPEVSDPEPGFEAVSQRYPQFDTELPLLEVPRFHLSEILLGKADPMKLLFPGGSFDKFDKFYKECPDFLALNDLIQEAVSLTLEALPENRTIRILEVGAGTGSLTRSVLPVLPKDRTEYTFTDITPGFIVDAKKQFSDYGFIEYRVLDIEKDPLDEGMDLHAFDLILATNVLHATSDLNNTLSVLRRLLASEGRLMFLEVTRQRLTLDMIFGLLKGWWLYTDTELRMHSALISPREWEKLLNENGFRNVCSFNNTLLLEETSQTIFLADSPEISSGESAPEKVASEGEDLYLILADEAGVGEALASRLERSDKASVIGVAGPAFARIDKNRFQFRPDCAKDLTDVINEIKAREGTFKGVVHCLSIDHPPSAETDLEALLAAQKTGVLNLLELAHSLIGGAFDSPPRVWVVTRGAQMTAEDDTLASIATAPLLGMIRVANNEHFEFRWTVIDLDPRGMEGELESLFEEITLDDEEMEISLRSGKRLVNRLQSVSLHDLPVRTRNAVQSNEVLPFRLEIATPGILANLSLHETERRLPENGEIEVQVAAGGINFRDVMKVLGMYPGNPKDLKWLGDDFSGTVVKVGEGVEDIRVGEEVVGMAPYCFRSYVTIDRRMVFRKSPHFTFAEAAALPTVYLTSHYALNHLAHLRKGEKVLIHSGTGGVGQAAIRLAQHIGAEIFSTAGSPEKRDFLRKMGVSHVMDSRSLDFADEIMEITKGRGVDVVLNALKGDFIAKNFSVLAPYGRFLEIGKVDIYQNSKIGLEPFKNNISFFAIDLAQHLEERPQYVASMLRELAEYFDAKALPAPPLKTFPISGAVEAFRYMAQGKHIGKNVLLFEEENIQVASPSDTETYFRDDATYLITGGSSGFGLQVAKWMARHGAGTLVLGSRSGPKSEEEKRDIQLMKKAGVDVIDARCDFTDEGDVARLISEIVNDLPPFKGIIHGAMVLDDDFIKDLDAERFNRVLKPKMAGGWLLHTLTEELPLDHFVCFSSISSMAGAGRQSNYCAGNYFLDALAHYRRSKGLPALTLNWGALLGAGFVERNKKTAQYLEKLGMKSFRIEEALKILAAVLPKDPVQLGAARVDWKSLAKLYPTASKSPTLSQVAHAHGKEEGSAGAGAIRPQILSAGPEERLNLMEDFICGQVAQVFGTSASKVDRATPLTQIGLDSLMAIELMNRLESNLGISLPIGQFLQGPDISELSASILEMVLQSGEGAAERSVSAASATPGIEVVSEEVREFPLSQGQKALWFLNRLAPKSSAYNLIFSSRITPYVDIPVMKKAFAALFERHPMLDVTFSSRRGELLQTIRDRRTIDFREHDATRLKDEEIKELLIEHANKPFDLEKGPVIRLELFRTADNAHVTLLCMHHIVSDAWSVALLMNDLIESYFSIKAGSGPKFKSLEYRYPDYVNWQKKLLESPESEKMLAYWKEELEGAAMVLDLPTDQPRPPVQSFNGATHGFKLKSLLTKKVISFAGDQNVTLFTALLSAFQVLLHRYCNQDDLLVGSPFAGRHHKEFHDLVGYFINPVALRSKVDDDPKLTDYLDRVSKSVINALENQEFPLSKLVDHLKVDRDSSRSPIFQVTFSMERIPGVDEQGIAVFLIGQGGHNFKVGDIGVESIDLNLRQAQFEISLVVEEAGGNIYGCWQYNRDLFKPETIAHLNILYEQVLEELVAHPEKRISEISFLSQEEERKILEEWNATAADCPDNTCLHQLVAEHAARVPEARAVTCGGQAHTYAELNELANGLAFRLREEGVGIDKPVGLLVDRSLDMLVGALGILKAGGCYVPLDPSFPGFRLQQMLDDARPEVIVAHRKLRGILPAGGWNFVWVEETEPAGETPLVKGQTTDSLAYIIYTSGSTGLPKGVEIPHRAVVNFLISMRDTPGLSADDTLLAVTTFSFDISILELFLPIISDAQVVIATREEATDGRRLSSLLDEYAVTTMQATPATWRMMLDSGWDGKHDLRIFCGGEALTRELAEDLLPCTRSIWNLYGPTETTIWSTVEKVMTGAGSVSIGRPIANTTVYILDDNHKALPPGFTGNLFIGGDGLARGYHNQPELTAEKFLEITLPNGKRERLYQTGDRARFRAGGKIDFLGRNDSQVKLRGYRIELGDIEKQLLSHPGVKSAVVMKRDDMPNENLAAYIIPENSQEGFISVLRTYISKRLPDYMRPAAYLLMEAFPLTPNEKIDRGKLPSPTVERADLQVDYMAPQTPSEKILIDILKEAFQSEQIGIRDNFFDLGGDSLLAVQILTEISQAFNRPLAVELFLQNPTVENLSRYLDTTPDLGNGESGSGNGGNNIFKESANDLDSSYLTVDIIDGRKRDWESLPKADAVALAYIPDAFLALTGLTKADIAHNWLHGQPFLSNLYETSFGRIGLIMLPRLGAELYKDQEILGKHILQAMEIAARMGAGKISLTGLIPSATDYGRLVEKWANGRKDLPLITTGHATTTATIIKSIEGLIERTGRDFASESVAIVGLGSIGYATLRLMLEVLPHPKALILCDLYQKTEVLEAIRRKLEEEIGFEGAIRIETTRGQLPEAVYDGTFILGATNVPGILDVNRLQPGTLIVDDSFPPCFRVFEAIKRLETQHDILFTTGGLLRLDEKINETIYLPNGTASLLEELGGNQLLALAGRDSREITGCILSSLLTGRKPEIRPTLGPVKVEDSLAHYHFLKTLGFKAARPQCENYFISSETIERFKKVSGSKATPAGRA